MIAAVSQQHWTTSELLMHRLILGFAILLAGCGDPVSYGDDVPAALDNNITADYEQFWVTSERATRRTCPGDTCGAVGQLFFRESAKVYERKDGWARISEPYPASCSNGRSEYVDSGNARCVEENGIVDGFFAEWVPLSTLANVRPSDPARTATADEKLVAQSDDFAKYRAVFVTAAGKLIDEGRCTEADFEEQGGWIKSINHGDEPIYFTYCGGMTIANRIYLDARTGRVFQ